MECEVYRQAIYNALADGQDFVDEHEHLKLCPACTQLVSDLKYIAEQAKLLLPMRDPDPKVWSGISAALEREGLRKRGQFDPLKKNEPPPVQKKWFFVRPAFVIFGVLIFVVILHLFPKSWNRDDLLIVERFGLVSLLGLMGYSYFLMLIDGSYYPFERVNNLLANEKHILEEYLTRQMAILLDSMVRAEIDKLQAANVSEREALFAGADRIRQKLIFAVQPDMS